MDTNIHADTHTEYTLGERERETESAVNSNWTVTDTNPEIKKYHNPIKTVTPIKVKGNTQINYLLPKDDLE